MSFLQLRIGGSVLNEQMKGVAADLDGPLTPETVAILQEIRSSLQNENPFADPPTSGNRGKQSSGKATIPCPLSANWVFTTALNLSWRVTTQYKAITIWPE